ncbi:DnaD domain-containing protein [Gracilibacillus caseinilyticus]|uniref:DnaD domain-containing protein n=1 Tax=Gracilibacillus caseinilyticus TaxID=2932256 RepID=A0ABY4EZK6_9BACI|nr:DnaD domain-containing protein [Gracilibacillus caseinilyticus]UOQ47606.1 DnaD domain-containing protein [Gracilibacillus caseinilyticus]
MREKMQTILFDQVNLPALLIERFAQLGMNETQLAIILQIYTAQRRGNNFPTPEELSGQLTISSESCSTLLRQLIQKGFLTIEEDKEDDQIIKETYSFEPLWEKLYQAEEKPKKQSEDKVGEVFQKFEREFGRPLSPFEIEMINNWLDEDRHDRSLIYAALREAVLMGKVNFKYIDRILMEWHKKGIKSLQQAQQTSRSFHQKQSNTTAKKSHSYDKSLYYNWLEE